MVLLGFELWHVVSVRITLCDKTSFVLSHWAIFGISSFFLLMVMWQTRGRLMTVEWKCCFRGHESRTLKCVCVCAKQRWQSAFNDSVNITICPNPTFEGGMRFQTSRAWNEGPLGEKTEWRTSKLEWERRKTRFCCYKEVELTCFGLVVFQYRASDLFCLHVVLYKWVRIQSDADNGYIIIPGSLCVTCLFVFICLWFLLLFLMVLWEGN